MSEQPKTFKEVVALVDQFTDTHDLSVYCHAHVVLEDYNLEDGFIYCAIRSLQSTRVKEQIARDNNLDEYLTQSAEDERLETIAFLKRLLTIPEVARQCWEDDDGNIVDGPDG